MRAYPLRGRNLLHVPSDIGDTHSPFLSIATVQKHAKKHEKDHPMAAKEVSQKMYVNDVLVDANHKVNQQSDLVHIHWNHRCHHHHLQENSFHQSHHGQEWSCAGHELLWLSLSSEWFRSLSFLHCPFRRLIECFTICLHDDRTLVNLIWFVSRWPLLRKGVINHL